MAKSLERLAENLRALWPHRFSSQTEFARAAGLSQAQINLYINGKAVPGLENIENMAGALGVSMAALLGNEVPALPAHTQDLEKMKLAALAGILSLDCREDLESILDALKPFLDRAGKKNQRRAANP